MGSHDKALHGINRFWRHIAVTTATPTLTVIQNALVGYRIVIEDIIIGGSNTNAAATLIEIRNITTTANIAAKFRMIAVSGLLNREIIGTCIPMAADEGIELVTSGALTGFVDATIVGRLVSNGAAMARAYTGAVT